MPTLFHVLFFNVVSIVNISVIGCYFYVVMFAELGCESVIFQVVMITETEYEHVYLHVVILLSLSGKLCCCLPKSKWA